MILGPFGQEFSNLLYRSQARGPSLVQVAELQASVLGLGFMGLIGFWGLGFRGLGFVGLTGFLGYIIEGSVAGCCG